MFKTLIAVALATAPIWSHANEPALDNADITVKINDLTEPNYTLPTTTIVISEAEIIQGGFASIVELLESYSSFRASTDSTGARRSTALDFRGFGETAARNVMVLVDGVPLNNPTLEAPNLGLIPVTSIRQVELVPSGAGVLFGNGAVGGVVRITTKNEPQELRSVYSTTIGSWGLIDASTRNTLVLEKSTMTGEIAKQSSDGYRHFNDSDLTHGKLTYALNGNIDFVFSHARSLDQRQASGASISSVIALDRKDSSINDRSKIDYRQAITSVSLGQEIGHKQTRMQLSHRQSDQNGSYENPSYGAIAQNLDVLNLKTELSSLGVDSSDRWLAGMEIGNGRYSSLYVSPYRKQTQAAIYGQKTVSLEHQRKLSFGARYQWLKDSMGTTYEAHKSLTAIDLAAEQSIGALNLRARIDQNFRYATLDEQSTSGDALSPQKGYGFEFTAEHPVGSVTWWLIKNKNEILFDANDTSQTSFGSNINVDKTTRTGASAAINADLGESSLVQAQVTYIDTLIEAGNFAGSMIPGVSPWQASLVFKTQFDDHIHTQISHRWYSSAYAVTDYENDLGRHNNYSTTSVNTTYQGNNWLLSFGINNLFDVDRDAYVYDSYGTLKRTPAEPQSFMLTFRYLPE